MKLTTEYQPRDRETLVLSIQSGWSPKWIFFWGHTPAPDGSITKSCFSQWWEGHPFELDGNRYLTTEHFMMAEKARLFGDSETLSEILESNHPALAKKLGRKVSGFDDNTWRDARFEIVVRGNLGKFSQHPELAKFLVSTGQRVLVEASPRDRIWGIGMGANNTNAQQPEAWRGENLLGFALMEVRKRLKGTQQEQS